MNDEITFLTYSFNDEKNEQFRISLFIEGLLSQNDDRWRLIFWDASKEGKGFNFPIDPRIEVIREEIDKSNWNSSYTRNILATKVETDWLCHTNADVYFSPDFVSVLNKHKNKMTLIQCQRRRCIENDLNSLIAGKTTPHEVWKHSKGSSQAACGECQCMNTRMFVDTGGYYGLIKDGIVKCGDWGSTGAQEDCDLWNFMIKKSPRGKKSKHKTNVVWINHKENAWLLHLFHPKHSTKEKWSNNKNKKK